MTSAAPTARNGSRGRVDTFTQSGRAEIVGIVNTLAEASHAQSDTTALLEKYPEINVLLAFNEPTSVGAAEAVESGASPRTYFLVGFDSNVATVDGLQEGSVDALIVQNPYAMGYLGWKAPINCSPARLRSGAHGGYFHQNCGSGRNLFTMDSQKPCSLLNSEPLSKTHNFFSLCFCTLLYWHNFYPSFGEILPCFSSCLLIKLNM